MQNVREKGPKNSSSGQLAAAKRQLDMACSLLGQGRFKAALQVSRPVAQYAPLGGEAAQVMASVLACIEPGHYEPDLEEDILFCFSRPELDHQRLASIAANQLLHKYDLVCKSSGPKPDWLCLLGSIAKDRLWLAFLSETINVSLPMESVLVELRKQLLLSGWSNALDLEPLTGFISALGIQCFSNQFVFNTTEAEEERLVEVEASLLSGQAGNSGCWGLLLALYRPITTPVAAELRQFASGRAPWVDRLLSETAEQPAKERDLGLQLPSISSVPVVESRKVQSQYEEYPYPRWKAPPAVQKVRLADVLKRLPGYKPSGLEQQPAPEVLVAGCGTGFEPISLARMDATLNITALDLSRTSLAYGTLRAQQLGLERIQFIQGDILHLEHLNKKFDVVVCTGVLHHMDDPKAGWEHLCRVTRPGGVMRVSLYSQYARERVAKARREIRRQGLSSTAKDIKTFRNWLAHDCSDPMLKPLTESTDYYSLSGCRDFLFHEREHRFTLLQVQSMLNELGLKLVGFDVPGQAVHSAFKQRFPEPDSWRELEKWDRFEQAYPETFSGMYQLWVQVE